PLRRLGPRGHCLPFAHVCHTACRVPDAPLISASTFHPRFHATILAIHVWPQPASSSSGYAPATHSVPPLSSLRGCSRTPECPPRRRPLGTNTHPAVVRPRIGCSAEPPPSDRSPA